MSRSLSASEERLRHLEAMGRELDEKERKAADKKTVSFEVGIFSLGGEDLLAYMVPRALEIRQYDALNIAIEFRCEKIDDVIALTQNRPYTMVMRWSDASDKEVVNYLIAPRVRFSFEFFGAVKGIMSLANVKTVYEDGEPPQEKAMIAVQFQVKENLSFSGDLFQKLNVSFT